MTEISRQLPEGFAALEPFVAVWAMERAAERAELRAASSPADMSIFYGVAVGLLPSALAHLDSKPLADHDRGERRLMQLMLSLAHVSLAVEIQGKDEAGHATDARHVRIIRATSEKDA